VPRPVKALLRPPYYFLKSAIGLRSLKKDYRSRYGPEFVFKVDDQDVMFQYFKHLCGGIPDMASRLLYLKTSEGFLLDTEDVLRQSGVSLRQVGSFLDFACGHGRLTRFLVHRVSRDRITVSDINKPAVDFVCNTFGVRGFYSVAAPENLSHDGRYDVIFVASLFSHLPVTTWPSWLSRLYLMLTKNGVLVFSTHGMDLCNQIAPAERKQLDTGTEGFLYSETTFGGGPSLPPDIYGTTYVSESYVRGVVASRSLGKLIGFYPKKLSALQDVYVITKNST
jgi:SAM-dependent methyltransferase